MRAWLGFILLWCGLFVPPLWQSAHAAETEPVDTGKVVASLVSTHDMVVPGEGFNVALRTVLDKGWHTYWRNPGDSGEAVQITWKLPDGVTADGELYWPLPNIQPTGPIINYGFEGAPLFPQDMRVAASVPVGTVLNIEADVYYLVCKDICIPEDTQLSLPIIVGESVRDNRWTALIDIAKDESPKPDGLSGGIVHSGDELKLTVTGLPEGADASDAYFFPHSQGVLAHSDPQTVALGSDGVQITTTPDYAWDSATPKVFSGVLSYVVDGMRVGSVVALAVGQTDDIGVVAVPPMGTGPSGGISSLTLLPAMIGALIGGLILNFMPCVFPVISIKALSIAKTAHGERQIVRREAWAYTFGVIATFLLLTLALLAFKAGGAQIGWGFQLQNPKVVGALAVLLFAVGLNLLGVFEIGTGLQNTGASLTQKGGRTGSFFTGALAVIVATPCTAPFMAGAMGYALAQPAYVTLAVFMALAVGFALPFLVIAYVPGLLSKLPKPGPWMVRFKEILAFPMFAAAIWLVWVLSLQAGEDGVLYVLIAMLAFALAVWFFKSGKMLSKVLGGAALLAALVMPFTITASTSSPILETQTWSPERVAALQAQNQAVFVDFTAAWCVTCKVNEKLVLNQARIQHLFTDTNTAFLIADWTNKDDVIAQELESHGRSGVPLYLYYPPPSQRGQNSVSPQILPQVLTEGVLKAALSGEQTG